MHYPTKFVWQIAFNYFSCNSCVLRISFGSEASFMLEIVCLGMIKRYTSDSLGAKLLRCIVAISIDLSCYVNNTAICYLILMPL